MERRLKERLVGAGILVILIVLLVPELLSGPKPVKPSVASVQLPPGEARGEPTRTVLVDLNTQQTLAPEASPDPSATSNPLPAEAPAPPPAPVISAVPAPPPTRPASVHAASPNAARSAPVVDNRGASSKSWSLQLGVFASRTNAEQLMRAVKAHNSPAYVSASGAGKQARWRVKVGPLADRAAAERMLAKLKGEGHSATVVAP